MALFKLVFGKSWLMFMVIVAAAGLGGGAYAAWTTSLHVEGVIQTGNVDVVWDMQEDFEFVEVLQPDGTMLPQVVPDDKQGAATCESDLQPGTTSELVRVQVSNAYPSYSCVILLGALVTGSVPVHIANVQTEALDAETGADVLGQAIDVDVLLGRKFADPNAPTGFRCDFRAPVGVSTQLHRGDRFCTMLRIHADMSAEQNHTYTAGVWIDLIQWNQASAQQLPADLAELVIEGNSLTARYVGAPDGTQVTAFQEVKNPEGDVIGQNAVGESTVQTEIISMSLSGAYNPALELVLAARFQGNIQVICCISIQPFVQVAGLEAVQSIQDLHDNVQMIRNKPTLVRAHLQPSFGGAIPNVVAVLHGSDLAGVPLAGSPLSMTNPGGSTTAQPFAIANFRDTLHASSASFQLPAAWLQGGLRLRVEVTSHGYSCRDKADADNDCRVNLVFNITDPPDIRWVKVQYTSGGSTHIPTSSEITELRDRFDAILPIASHISSNSTYNAGSGVPTLSSLNNSLAWKRFWDLCWNALGCDRIYYGVLVDAAVGGLAKGIPGDVASGNMPSSPTVYGRNRHAHEIAHSLNRHHAANQADNGTTVIDGVTYKLGYCTSVASLSAPEFPYTGGAAGARAALGPMTSGLDSLVYGWDSHRNVIIDPAETFELMSYCGGISAVSGQSRWISRFTYDGVRSSINSRFSGPQVQLVETPGAVYLAIAGTVDLNALEGNGEGKPAEFVPFGSMQSDILPPQPERGPFTAFSYDAQGNLVSRVEFTPQVESPDPEKPGAEDPPGRTGSFLVPVEDTEGKIARVEISALTDGGKGEPEVLASIARSQNAPVMDFTATEEIDGGLRFNWVGVDEDEEPLFFLVQIDQTACEPDLPPFVGVHTAGIWRVDSFFDVFFADHDYLREIREAAEGKACNVLRVTASDGFNSTAAESAPFALPVAGPQ